jgi:hypothetical protein
LPLASRARARCPTCPNPDRPSWARIRRHTRARKRSASGTRAHLGEASPRCAAVDAVVDALVTAACLGGAVVLHREYGHPRN